MTAKKIAIQKNVKNKQDWENISVRENLGRKVNVHKFDKDKVTIVLMGDEHIGSKFYDESTHDRFLNWCYETKSPIILMGDEMECMDIDTQILTEDGWKYFGELGNKKVMTYSKDKNNFELQNPIKKVLYNYKGDMYHFNNKKLDMLVTPNHRILCRHHKGELKVRRADDFTKLGAKSRCWNIPCSANWNIEEYNISDDWIKLIGWIITEGWNDIRGNSIRYYTSQSKKANPENYIEILEILERLKIKYKERFIEETETFSFRLSATTPILKELIGKNTKSITREILNHFSKRQLRLLFGTLIKGDGGKKGDFFTNSKILKDDFLELCSKVGKLASVSWVDNGYRGLYTIYTGNGKGNRGGKKYYHNTITNLDILKYDGEVWCVAVPNNFLLVKRNNSVFITGNTATKTSVGAGVYEQNEIVQGQLEKTFKKYKPMADAGLILGNHIGNHEARVYNSSGVNLSKILAQMLDIDYLGLGAAHIIRVGNQSYAMYTTHGSSGARMPHTKIANTIKLSSMIDTDIYAQGHLHQLSHHTQNYYKINKSNRTVEEHQKHYIITGAYLDHWGSYAQMQSYEPARKGSPKLKLSGLEKQIRVSL